MQNLTKKYGSTALVTGGSSGIGKAFALELAKQGVEPILIARNKENLDIAALEIYNTHKIKPQVFSVDLSDEAAIKTFLPQIENQEIGLFIHCAGVENNGRFTKISPEKELQMIQLNITSTYILTNHFAKKMSQKRRGGILLVSSLAGLMPTPYFSNYGATKSYVYHLGVSLYPELKEKGVDISVLAPGLSETNMTISSGIDWSKIPLSNMPAAKVARISLNKLGKKASIIPGIMNNIMAAMTKRAFSMKGYGLINAWMIKRAIPKDKL